MKPRYLASIVLLLFGTAPPVLAQSSACAGSVGSEKSLMLLRHFASSSSSTAQLWRSNMNLPFVADSASVLLIQEDSICALAKTAYFADTPSANVPPDARVWLFRVGNRYVVEVPTLPAGEFSVSVVTDSTFTPLIRAAH